METCNICSKQFNVCTLKNHKWRCYQTSISTTAGTDVIDHAILTADVDRDMAEDSPDSPMFELDDGMSDYLEDRSDSGPLPVTHGQNRTVTLTFHPDLNRNTLAPDNDCTDDEDGARSEDDPMFDYVSLINHIGEQELDQPFSSTGPSVGAARPPSASTIMDLYHTPDNGELPTMNCVPATDGYLKIGQPADYSMFELI